MVNTTASPLISVIIPSFNRGQLIERAVYSAFDQQNVEIEVIVVDDGSTDNTADVLTSLKQKYGSALRVHTQPNLGASAARNAGLDLAMGDYVQFLDSDDTLEPQKICLQLAAHLSNPSLSVVLCHGFLEESDGSERIICPNLGEDPQLYIERMCGHDVLVIPTLAPLWRRSFLTVDHRWSPEISLGDDLEFHVRCFADIELVRFIGRPLFNVRAHSGDRLSDFSAKEDRLVALFNTRVAMHDVLKIKGRWSEICAQNMVVALRSIYVVYLQRMSILDILNFEQAALVMVGPRWRGFRLSVVRRQMVWDIFLFFGTEALVHLVAG